MAGQHECPLCRYPVPRSRLWWKLHRWAKWPCPGCGSMLAADTRPWNRASIAIGLAILILVAVVAVEGVGIAAFIAIVFYKVVYFCTMFWLLSCYGVRLSPKHDGLYCPKCSFDLRGTYDTESAACPECGEAFAEHWRGVKREQLCDQKAARRHRAPRPWLLRFRVFLLLSPLVILIVVGIIRDPTLGLWSLLSHRNLPIAIVWVTGVVCVPILLIMAYWMSMVRGYELRSNTLHIVRTLRPMSVDLSNLLSAEFDATALTDAKRINFTDGLPGLPARYHSERYGDIRAFATDPKRMVVLRCKSETLVVTPVDAQAFIKALGK